MPSKMLILLVLACGLIAASLAAGIFLVLAELRQSPANVAVTVNALAD